MFGLNLVSILGIKTKGLQKKSIILLYKKHVRGTVIGKGSDRKF